MADIVVALSVPDPATGVQLKERYRDMGDGTHARVVSNAAGGGGGSGDVVGPASAVNNGLALFDGTSGKLLKNSSTLAAALAALGVYPPATVTLDADDLAALDTVPFVLVPEPAITDWIAVNRMVLACTDRAAIGPTEFTGLKVEWEGTTGISTVVGPLTLPGASDGFTAPIGADPIDGDGPFDLVDVLGKAIIIRSTTPIVIPAGTGPIVATTLFDGGTGYAVNDAFTVDDSGTATGIVTAVTGGVVTAYTITAPGDGYAVAGQQNTTATSGIGTGLQINITDVDAPANPIKLLVRTTYDVVTAP